MHDCPPAYTASSVAVCCTGQVVFPDVARSILWGYNWKSDWDKDRFKFNQYSECDVGSYAACTA